ncbi:MAG: DUF177 domain-containing protein [Candidatus Marinimicrobia bacterium]|jgi:uncharacterized protein|nr:DUF177 domain-containing protein [Candidatus Neomarinimicrobiota bacterium]MBT3937189.1 DUF177 domain-containing protein [Candidatus Neomarinimicrobiota bacterium]MBT3960859.1 DUF177 domain-containing protein [Candidatus Neomarinimicrobiota bacterium]MBT4383553.1 DUF177 domain-containing protein [Candidatus Neomarinimicrobiota bacterium]MBT4636851.1 DUF177 domain-containing protein [Candidatus Neomarinimicrobiota bacterium]
MKLFRTELASEFKDKLFDIESVELTDDIIVAETKGISCILSAEKTHYGYQLNGIINTQISLQCDRCLNTFLDNHNIPFNFWLTSDKSLTETNEQNVIQFDSNQECIDLKDVISELIFVDIPFKLVCMDDCKGLCDQCGTDLNKETCECKTHNKENF